MFVKRGKFPLPPTQNVNGVYKKICVTTIVPSVFIIAHQCGIVKEKNEKERVARRADEEWGDNAKFLDCFFVLLNIWFCFYTQNE